MTSKVDAEGMKKWTVQLFECMVCLLTGIQLKVEGLMARKQLKKTDVGPSIMWHVSKLSGQSPVLIFLTDRLLSLDPCCEWSLKRYLTALMEMQYKSISFQIDMQEGKMVPPEKIKETLRIGETIELKCPFMVPRLNLNEYWNDYLSGPDGSFLSVKVQEI